MKKSKLLLFVGLFGFVGFAFANKQIRPAGTGPMSAPLGESIAYRPCIEQVEQASDKLRELRDWIIDQKEKMSSMKFASKVDRDKYGKRIELHIKGTLKEVKELINEAEKQAVNAV